ncbi:MAG: 1,4-dihydroxy-6-naphthoate synthase [Syntrophobacteraceae bacterium]
MKPLKIGFSPCPNDTYIFYALAEGAIDTDPYRFEVMLADVELLNHHARQGLLDVCKVSIHAVGQLLDRYWLLGAGGAIGRGCGPLVVSKVPLSPGELLNKRVAIPGKMTTANCLLRLTKLHEGETVEMVFDQIMPAVASGHVDAGVIIHEGRFTYGDHGLQLVLDLGAWWEKTTGLPLPLGGIVVRRDLGRKVAGFVESKIRESLLYSRAHSEMAWPYIVKHAQEMAPDVIRSHIDTFVNDYSLKVGKDGKEAIHYLLQAASKLDHPSPFHETLFWND